MRGMLALYYHVGMSQKIVWVPDGPWMSEATEQARHLPLGPGMIGPPPPSSPGSLKSQSMSTLNLDVPTGTMDRRLLIP